MKILVTGGTGYLGSEVVQRLLARGHQVTVITRQDLETEHPRLSYMNASLDRELPASLREMGFGAVLHMAALTSLRRRRTPAEFTAANVTTTINVATLAKALTIPYFHTSTIYVSGDWSGEFTEQDFDLGQGFKNHYEQSKFAAEHWVRHNLDPEQVAIFRPGILIGRYSDGRSTQFEGFYRPVKAIVACEEWAEGRLGLPKRRTLEEFLGLPPLKLPIRIHGDPDSTLALTPVDCAAEAIVRRINEESLGSTFHICPSRLPTNAEIASAVCDGLRITGLHFSLKGSHEPLSLMYNRLTADFTAYLARHAQYQTSAGAEIPAVDHEYLLRVVSYWRKEDVYGHVRHAEEVR